MKLSLYFARVYLAALLLILTGLVIIIVATTLMDNAGHISRSDESGVAALLLAAYGSVQYAYQLFPIACFLALLVAGTFLARSGELLAVQAAGISTLRVAVALFVVVVLVTAVGGVAGELVVPEVNARYDKLYYDQLGRGYDTLTRFFWRQTEWFREGDTLLYLPNQDRETQSFKGVEVYTVRDGLIASVTHAERLEYSEAAWWLINTRAHDVVTSVVQHHERERLPLQVSPRDLMDLTGDPRVMSSREVSDLIARREHAGFDAIAYRVEWHNRAAYPLTAIVLFLLGVAWALNPDRRRSLAVNLGAGVVAIALFLALAQVFRLVALARRMPAPLGAWAIDVVCLLLVPLSLAAYRRYVRRGSLWR